MTCTTCTCLAGGDLYYLDLMHNFSISAKKDVDDLDHDLSQVCCKYNQSHRKIHPASPVLPLTAV